VIHLNNVAPEDIPGQSADVRDVPLPAQAVARDFQLSYQEIYA